MGKEILSFGNTEIEKNKFYCHNTPIFFGDVDIEKVLVSKKIYFGEKNYKVNHKVRPIIKLSHYIKCFLNKCLCKKL